MNRRFVARHAAGRRFRVGVLASGLIATAASACDFVVPDFNNPSVEDLQNNPSRAAIAAAAQGLLFDARITAADMVMWVGAFGREVYPMAPTGSALPGSVRDPWDGTLWVGTQVWAEAYRNIRNANLLLDALSASELPESETAAVRGFAKTIQAYEFLHVAVTRRRLGAPVAVGADPNADPAPIVSEADLYDHVASLLDDARSDLIDADAFPFSVPDGLDAFDAPSSFLALNRALKARAEVQRNNWAAALQALSESFLDPDRPLDYGAYHDWSVNSGDMANPANRPDLLWANPRFRDEAQTRADGSRDLRFATKFKKAPAYQLLEVASDLQYTLYENPDDPFVWIKNEELVLAPRRGELGHGRSRSGDCGHQLGPRQVRRPRAVAGSLPRRRRRTAGRVAVQQAILAGLRVGPHLDRHEPLRQADGDPRARAAQRRSAPARRHAVPAERVPSPGARRSGGMHAPTRGCSLKAPCLNKAGLGFLASALIANLTRTLDSPARNA